MSENTELDLDALERAALTAQRITKEESWRFSEQFNVVTTSEPGIIESERVVAQTSVIDDNRGQALGQYIAATQPAVVLELVRRLRAAEALLACSRAGRTAITHRDVVNAAADGQKSFERFVATGTVLNALPAAGDRTLPLNWNPVPETLPPNPDNFFSPRVWLALSDGRVSVGCCLHHEAGVISKRPVHAWFVDDEELDEDGGVTVVAWMPFAVPDHPQRVLVRSAAEISRKTT